MTRPAVCVLVLAFLAAPGCSRDRDTRRFELAATVVSVDPASRGVVVDHEAIAGLMPAMRMPFGVEGTVPPLRPGDRISAALVVTSASSWLEDVRITGAVAVPAAGEAPTARATPGLPVPVFHLLDQDGRARTLQDPAGRVQVLTFIYTRCPLPEFCPLMVRHLENVRDRASRAGIADRLALVGITLDPAFDTPAVLRAYGTSMVKGDTRFDHWTFATGTATEIATLARFFGVGYQAEGITVTHTLATAVITHDGRIMRVFAANSWHPDELFDAVRQAIERAKPGTTQ